MQGGVHAAGERVFAGEAQVAEVVQIGDIQWRIEAIDGFGGGGQELLLALRQPGAALMQRGFFPLVLVVAQFLQGFAVVHEEGLREQKRMAGL